MTAIVACRSGLYLFRAVLSSAQTPTSLRVRLGCFSRANPGHFWRALKYNPQIFGGKPIVRGHRLAVEHVLGMLAAGDNVETVVSGHPWMEREDVLACLAYSRRVVGHERIEPLLVQTGT